MSGKITDRMPASTTYRELVATVTRNGLSTDVRSAERETEVGNSVSWLSGSSTGQPLPWEHRPSSTAILCRRRCAGEGTRTPTPEGTGT